MKNPTKQRNPLNANKTNDGLFSSDKSKPEQKLGGGALFWLLVGDSSLNSSSERAQAAARASLIRINNGFGCMAPGGGTSSSVLGSYFSGRKNEPKPAQNNVITAKINTLTRQPKCSTRKCMIGAMINIPIPEPQTAIPVANAHDVPPSIPKVT
ncbi:hypothetical protein DERF_003439 [Dermatophagoides farinae]|uniref:Uncharacterized protein n=1 Tax=Dermatophagoides farinae TaxID=6954 RepID=A0A922IDK8_DERFA|nr:hypothetical protein DERF_003439 [Dermatophagoides farinae]